MSFPPKILQVAFTSMLGPAKLSGSGMSAHIPTLYILATLSNGPVVEIGAGCSTLALLAGCSATKKKLVTYDINPSSKNRVLSLSGFPETDSTWNAWTHIVRDSVTAAKDWKDNEVSLLFIDTVHSLECTRRELYAWYPKIKQDGIICGHDYFLEGVHFNVAQAVNEFEKIHTDRFCLQVFHHDKGLFVLWPKLYR